MGTTILAILVGIIFGGLWTFIIDLVTKRRNIILWVLDILAGAIGAVSANQLLVYGPSIFGISIVPAIVGAIVLSIVVTWCYLKLTKTVH